MRFAVINLFNREVEQEVASEQEAISHVIGMAGMVVVDRAEKRIYDGEYQQWYPVQDYARRYPAIAWITEV